MAANRERKAKEDALNNKGAPTKKVRGGGVVENGMKLFILGS